jgi:dTDP-4-amino-4,6-dideoxygalactose transaminase
LIDSADLEEKLAAVKAAGKLKPRAVIPVDLFGLPADYTKLAEIAEAQDLFLLGDAAQSLGGIAHGRAVGSLAPATATSFFPAKPLGCYGDGGALLTDDSARAELWRSLRGHGTGKAKYDVVRIGLNSRLDTLQAAILLAKLDAFEAEIVARDQLANKYAAALGGVLKVPQKIEGVSSAWAQYTVQHEDRDGLKARLGEKGVPSAIYYPLPMHLQTAYRSLGDGEGSLPVTESLCSKVLSLPMHPYMDDATAERICEAVLTSL